MKPDRGRPRGSTAWVGLDPFGDATVDRLARWFADDAAGRELADANRLLPGLRVRPEVVDDAPPEAGELTSDVLLDDDERDEPEPLPDLAAMAIAEALAALLAAQQSRAALSFADRELLTPHVVLVADLDSAEAEGLAGWAERLQWRLRDLKVEARLLLVLRHLGWGQADEAAARAALRSRELVERLAGERMTDDAAPIVYVVTDRDGIGGRYSAEETDGLLWRFTDFLLLGDLAHAGHPGSERAFHPPVGRGAGGWDTEPAFASVAGCCLLWDAPSVARENAERRRADLFDALDAPVPPGYEPRQPDLERVVLADPGTWPQLDVPTWAPRFWRTAQEEDARVQDLLDGWRAKATDWRHQMLVTHRDRKDNLEHRARAARESYAADLDARERSVLDDSSLAGFFAPLQRLYDRATADLLVRKADTRPPDSPDAAEFDPVEKVRRPADVMADADARLVRALERKINPALLAQVTILTIAAAWITTAWVLARVADWLDGSSVPSAASIDFWSDPLGWIRQELEFAGYGLRDLLVELFDLDNRLPGLGPIVLWTGILTVVPLTAIAVFLALRQRVALERAWNSAFSRARAWREETGRLLSNDVKRVETALTRENLDVALEEVDARRQRLGRFAEIGARPVSDEVAPDLAVSGHIRPARPAPAALSPLLVGQIVSVFKREASRLPTAQWSPQRLLDLLFAEASELASDPAVELRGEIPLIRRRVLTSMPPDGAVRVQQLDSTARAELSPPPVVRYLGVPAGTIGEFRRDPERVTVIELPVEDRFYALVIQTGMSARRVLSLPLPDPDGDPPVPPPPAGPDDGAEAGPVDAIESAADVPGAGEDAPASEEAATAGVG